VLGGLECPAEACNAEGRRIGVGRREAFELLYNTLSVGLGRGEAGGILVEVGVGAPRVLGDPLDCVFLPVRVMASPFPLRRGTP
jgi:hypothetical protein